MNPSRFLTIALLAASLDAAAQPTVYRCGNEYTRVPCSDGKVVDTRNSATSTNEAEAARAYAAREKKAADQMQRERLRADASPRPGAASLSPATSGASAPLKPKKGAKGRIRVFDANDFTATTPKKTK